MIEQALYQHLQAQDSLSPYMATYGGKMAIFNQKAPSDQSKSWGSGPQYGRIVFDVDLQGDPERTMGGMLSVDIMCKNDSPTTPDQIEPIVRSLIHGYFFSNGTFTVSAQWKNSAYFTQSTDHVEGCTLTFDLLAFPLITTPSPDVVARYNAWSSQFPNLHVINCDGLPQAAWKPKGDEIAVYWRVMQEAPAGWIRDTYATIWRTATVKGHIFAETPQKANYVARDLTIRLYASKRLLKDGESPIMVNRRNTADYGADPLRAGQVTSEATFGIIVVADNSDTIQNIQYT